MKLKIVFTDKEITQWKGMALLKNILDQIKFREVVNNCYFLPKPGLNRGYRPVTILESFFISVWYKANRFLHSKVTRHDNTPTQIFDWKRVWGHDTYKRYFARFSQSVNQNVFDYFCGWFFSQLKFDHFTLDLDSSILTRYQEQKGSIKEYYPQKPVRPSQYHLMAFIADTFMVANLRLSSGVK